MTNKESKSQTLAEAVKEIVEEMKESIPRQFSQTEPMNRLDLEETPTED